MDMLFEHLQWPVYVGCGLLILAITIVAYVRITARLGEHHQVTFFEKPGGDGADHLVVLVPGYTRGPRDMGKVQQVVHEAHPQADILIVDYSRFTYSNADPFQIADKIEGEVDKRYRERRYNYITLLGYSMGALLARKAYVYGCGSVADAPTADPRAEAKRDPKEWVRNGPRFVLLAGMNRGWDPDYRRIHTQWLPGVLFRLGLFLAKRTHTGLLIRQAMRGEPFVANLRLQWLEVVRNADALDITRPTVIQLLGDKDDVVSEEDSRDVTVSHDFIWVTVYNTRHYNMCDVGETGARLERKRKIKAAFGDDKEIERLRRTNPVLASNRDDSVRTVVFVLHGIRDMGEWTSEFEEPLQTEYLSKPLQTEYLSKFPKGAKMHVHRASYGFFPMGPFLLFGDRQKNVRWFMDQITELTARFPNMEEIHFIGHSNGTYVLASALEKYRTLKVKRVVLAGSVIRRDFHWSAFAGRVEQVRNYVGSGDLVVGLLPRLFELAFFKMFNPDIGSAGFNGFEDDLGQRFQTRYVKGGHSAALVRENVDSIVQFVVHGTRIDIDGLCTPTRPQWMQLISNVCWCLWIIGVAVLIWAGWEMPYLVFGIMDWHPGNTWWIPWGIRVAYMVVLWLILVTI
jgi:pimeloyl-ACP methyl ester carboxylesterase